MGAESLEAVGEAVTGGLAARAVEPGAGEAGVEAGSLCLNCGTELVGAHCHQCGQPAHVHRTLAAFWHDIAHSVVHFDGKLWRTLPLLAWRPGELTRRYVEGQRARFVSPMALFLFSVFLMFAVFTAIGGPLTFKSDPKGSAEAAAEFRQETAARQERLDELRRERAQQQAQHADTRATDLAIADLERQIAFMRATERVVASGTPAEVQNALEKQRRVDAENRDVEANTGWPTLDNAIRKASENPSLLFYKIQTNAYKFSWALIPLSVPFLWLLFLHRRRYRAYGLYDHTVFVTYSIAFMSLALIALSLLRPLGLSEALIGLAIFFVPPVHMYRQLRGAYRLSRFSALWRTALLLLFAMIAAGLFFMLLVTLGAFA